MAAPGIPEPLPSMWATQKHRKSCYNPKTCINTVFCVSSANSNGCFVSAKPIRFLGEGGFGSVTLCDAGGEEFALKCIRMKATDVDATNVLIARETASALLKSRREIQSQRIIEQIMPQMFETDDLNVGYFTLFAWKQCAEYSRFDKNIDISNVEEDLRESGIILDRFEREYLKNLLL